MKTCCNLRTLALLLHDSSRRVIKIVFSFEADCDEELLDMEATSLSSKASEQKLFDMSENNKLIHKV